MRNMPSRTDGPVERLEYEAFVRNYESRHAELRVSIREMEVETDKKIDILSAKVDRMNNELTNSINTLTIRVSRQGLDMWKLVATGLASGIIGYLAALFQHILGH